MQQSSNYTLLYPNVIDWGQFTSQKVDEPFSDIVIEYLNALSISLLKDRTSRLYPDVGTFAFFCRKSNLLKMKRMYADDTLRLGRGILFHIAPSNIPINFGYTFVAGLLAGNNNIVRISSKEYPQVNMVVRHIQALALVKAYSEVARRLVLVKYGHASNASAFFSSFADVRVIWGGDDTISTIRKNELPPRSFDVCFADRYSVAVINPLAIMQASDTDINRLAESFYNDTYLFDQNACSSPHFLFWQKGDNLLAAKNRFWNAVHQLVEKRYHFQEVLAVNKLMAFSRQAIYMNTIKEPMPDNLVVRVRLRQLHVNIDAFRCAGGYFSEYDIECLDEISTVVSRKYQTLAYYGICKDELSRFVKHNRLCGLDRIVPIGGITVFSLTWDGNNLVEMFSRIVTVL